MQQLEHASMDQVSGRLTDVLCNLERAGLDFDSLRGNPYSNDNEMIMRALWWYGELLRVRPAMLWRVLERSPAHQRYTMFWVLAKLAHPCVIERKMRKVARRANAILEPFGISASSCAMREVLRRSHTPTGKLARLVMMKTLHDIAFKVFSIMPEEPPVTFFRGLKMYVEKFHGLVEVRALIHQAYYSATFRSCSVGEIMESQWFEERLAGFVAQALNPVPIADDCPF